MTEGPERIDGARRASVVLFLCLFAGQAAVIALAPVLAEVARDLGVSTAAAGQLRTVAGLAAAAAALASGRLAARHGTGRVLVAAGGLLAAGSLAAAAAPSLGVLALAHVPLGAGIGAVTSAGTLAAAQWVAPAERPRVLAWALAGQPAAWVVGMPLVGFVGEHHWRLAWIVLPLAAALVAVASLLAAGKGRRPDASAAATVPLRGALVDARVSRWLAAEALANSAWAGTLVFSGALFVESYGSSSGATGLVLAVAALAYIAGNLGFRRAAGRESARLAVGLPLALAVLTASFGALRPSVAASALVLSLAGFAAGARTLVSSARALALPAELRPSALGLRAGSMQLGYFVGASLAGAALAAGGYPAFGLAVGGLFLASAAVLAPVPRGLLRLYRPATAHGSTTDIRTEGEVPMHHTHILHTTMHTGEPRQVARRRDELARHRAEVARARAGRLRRVWQARRPGALAPAGAANAAVALRLATVRDDEALRQLALLGGRQLPQGELVVAEVDGEVVAAHPIAGGETIADPFRASAYLLPLLRVRAEQLAEADAHARRGVALRLAALVRGS